MQGAYSYIYVIYLASAIVASDAPFSEIILPTSIHELFNATKFND